MTDHRAYVGVGTNLGDRIANIERAFEALNELGSVLAQSSVYRTKPWGKTEQPWFANAVVLLKTHATPRALLDALHDTEKRLGRTPAERWGPRSIDLDLLVYDDLEIDEPGLRVPHAHLHERAFVLVPLAEIDAHFEAMRDALPVEELAGVELLDRARSVLSMSESRTAMPSERSARLSERVRALARFLADGDAVRVRIDRPDETIEITCRSRTAGASAHTNDGVAAQAQPPKIDAIKADLVGIFHVSRPAPLEGDRFEADRELGYIEALGIRTPVHSRGAGRLVSIATPDGAPVEYGQPLFLMARGH
jgi:2-amino-4-hydroxy-6-hydroxymethyldihydropteridine diphosphokinase